MSQGRDPAIKLFGRNIPLTDSWTPTVSEQDSDLEPQASSNPLAMVQNGCEEGIETAVDSVVEQSCEQSIHSELDNQKDIDHQNSMQKNAKVVQNLEEDRVDKSDTGGQEKVLKKPNKVLPCPRCKSLETKFCYFNNYNVSQPRHFCKNCQRYWTAGGTIRNVPVGAGRRKNKHSGAQCHQVVVPSNVTQVTRADTLNSTSNQRLSCVGLPASSRLVQGIGEVQKFRKDAALCESMATVLNLEEEKRSIEIGPSASEDISDEPLSPGSSLAATTSQESEFREKEIEQVGLPRHCNGSNTTQTLHCYAASQCAHHFNPGWNMMVFGSSSGISNTAHIGSPPMVPVPGFCAPGITFPFLPGQYWGCMPSWDARKWNTLLVGSTGGPSAPSSTSNSSCSGNSSPTLGKHLRDADSQGEETKEQCLWVPKTLRIDDPEEAAKSSIWSTLGIKPGKDKSSIRGGIFKASQSKSDSCTNTSDADQVLKANPAAFSRCQSFQEST